MSDDKNKPIVVSSDDFQKLVLNSDKPVIVDFWAQWCRPCVAMAPSLDQLSGEFAGQLIIAKVNIEEGENEKLAEQLNVRGFPSLIFFHKGQEVKRVVGAQPRARLHIEFEQFLTSQGLLATAVTAEQQVAFDAAVAAAEEQKERHMQSAGDKLKANSKAEFDELDAVRAEFLKSIADELPADKREIAMRGAAGEFDEPIFELFVEHRGRIDSDERFAALAARSSVAIEKINSPENQRFKDEMFAEIEDAESEFNTAVEAARQKYLIAPNS